MTEFSKLREELALNLRGAEAFTEDTIAYELADVRMFIRALAIAEAVEEVERALTLLCAMIDDGMVEHFANGDGPEYVPGESDVEIILDGSFKLSDARAALAKLKQAREG